MPCKVKKIVDNTRETPQQESTKSESCNAQGYENTTTCKENFQIQTLQEPS